jgi:hypothetical protein
MTGDSYSYRDTKDKVITKLRIYTLFWYVFTS